MHEARASFESAPMSRQRDHSTPPPLPAPNQAPSPAEPVVLREPDRFAQTPPQHTVPDAPERANIPARWRGIVGTNEAILWQGQPRAALARLVVRKPSLFGAALMTGFSIFWMSIAARGGGFIWAFGLIFLFRGLRSLKAALTPAQGNAAADAVHASDAPQYLLTTRAAYIMQSNGTAERVAITPHTPLRLHKGRKPSVTFARPQVSATRGRQQTSTRPYGFENIDGAEQVYAMMREIAQEME